MDTQALIDAQVQFHLDRISGKALQKTIKTEVDAAWDWLDTITVSDISDRDRVVSFVQRNAVERPLAKKAINFIQETTKRAFKSDLQHDTRLGDLTSDDLIADAVEVGIGLKKLRDDAIHDAINNPMYGTLISDVLYTGIKDYLLEDNIIAKKMPGVGSLLSKGSDMLSKRAPGFEKQFEEKVKASIEGNIASTLEQSEKFIKARLTDEAIRDNALAAWKHAKKTRLSIGAEYIDGSTIDEAVNVGAAFWEQFRKTDYFIALCGEIVDQFFAEFGQTSCKKLLEDLKITKTVVTKELNEALEPLASKAIDTGFIEARLRANLTEFYATVS